MSKPDKKSRKKQKEIKLPELVKVNELESEDLKNVCGGHKYCDNNSTYGSLPYSDTP